MIINSKKTKNKLLSIFPFVVENSGIIEIVHPLIRNIKTSIDTNSLNYDENQVAVVSFSNLKKSFSIEFIKKVNISSKKKEIKTVKNEVVAIIDFFFENEDKIDLESTTIDIYEI